MGGVANNNTSQKDGRQTWENTIPNAMSSSVKMYVELITNLQICLSLFLIIGRWYLLSKFIFVVIKAT